MAIVHADELIGGMSLLTGEGSFFSLKTRQESRLAIVMKEDIYAMVRHQPLVVLKIAYSVVQRLSPFVRQVDYAIDWEMHDAGYPLYSQNDSANCLYIVLSGRLRSVLTEEPGIKKLVEEYGRGDLVGL
ncbi:unnamed protein product, partial [Soboliphyme baturini]|uniref:Cyclic nucleotide-binding domain-containing protein n=1 Tax=Soboliphyme baturini TaxID=241478 RepID=A0A183IKT8_9BILA